MAVSGCLALQVAVSVALLKIHQEALQRALLHCCYYLQHCRVWLLAATAPVSLPRQLAPPSLVSQTTSLSTGYSLVSNNLPSILFGLKHFQLYSVYNALLGASITLIALSAQGCIHTMIFSYRNVPVLYPTILSS